MLRKFSLEIHLPFFCNKKLVMSMWELICWIRDLEIFCDIGQCRFQLTSPDENVRWIIWENHESVHSSSNKNSIFVWLNEEGFNIFQYVSLYGVARHVHVGLVHFKEVYCEILFRNFLRVWAQRKWKIDMEILLSGMALR